MKFIIDNLALIGVAVISGGMLLWTSFSRGGGSGGVTAAEAVRLMNREKGVMIDVCEPAEHAAGFGNEFSFASIVNGHMPPLVARRWPRALLSSCL